MPRLSENFHTREFICSCGCGFGSKKRDIDPDLIEGLQAIRNIIGQPIFVRLRLPNGEYHPAGSGCRCLIHNTRIGSRSTSKHIKGMAADIWWQGDVNVLYVSAHEVSVFLHGGIGYYPHKQFVHVDVGPQRRWYG